MPSAAFTPVQRPLTCPVALSISSATVPLRLGLNALLPLPRSLAASGMPGERPFTLCIEAPASATLSAPEYAGLLPAMTEFSTTRCSAPPRSAQLTVTDAFFAFGACAGVMLRASW